ncbi:hypothetical protein EAM_0489 [Erwinia amylovora ATCC 49946]|nr:hypothetical protein EAM_0489 [Erwinia amylovora ATCC 49946]
MTGQLADGVRYDSGHDNASGGGRLNEHHRPFATGAHLTGAFAALTVALLPAEDRPVLACGPIFSAPQKYAPFVDLAHISP